MGREAGVDGESLADLLGGRRGAIEATLPPLAFGVGWLLGGRSLGGGRGRRRADRPGRRRLAAAPRPPAASRS